MGRPANAGVGLDRAFAWPAPMRDTMRLSGSDGTGQTTAAGSSFSTETAAITERSEAAIPHMHT
jgi:hypothetical protein